MSLDILQVVHGFPPANRAGAELFAHGLSRHLVEAGHRVRVFHRVADPTQEEYAVERGEVSGLPVLRVNNNFRDCDRFERTYRNEIIDRIFGEVLDEQRPDVVHFHHVTCLSTNLIAVARQRDIPVVYTLHDFWLICQRGQFLKPDLALCPGQEDRECARCLSWQLDLGSGRKKAVSVLRRVLPGVDSASGAGWKRRLKGAYRRMQRAVPGGDLQAEAKVRQRMEHVRAMCSQVNRFIAPSKTLRQRYVEFGIPAERIDYSRYGFETSYYAHARRPPDGTIRFGYLGTWIPPKGVHVLIQAFNEIADPRAHLHIYGHPLAYEGYEDYDEQLRGLIRSPRIHLDGLYENDQVGAILAGIDVLVVPSIWLENSPLTIQEAMLAGTPIIASDLGGMAELVEDGVNGLRFAPRDPAALQSAMQRLIDDEALRRRLRPRRGAVKDLTTSARQHVELYRELTGHGADSRDATGA